MNAPLKKIEAAPKLTTRERQKHNLELALALVALGLKIFPSEDKTPKVKAWPREDITISEDERREIVADYISKGKTPPLHFGCTGDRKTVEKLWRKFPDAVPSIACGPSGLIVVDADEGIKKDGSAKQGLANLDKFIAENDADANGAFVVRTRSGGKHLYFRNPEGLGSSPGKLRGMDIDIKGSTGQVVAPGSIRKDGARYEIVGALEDILSVPDLPAPFAKALKQTDAATKTTATAEAMGVVALAESDIPEFDDLFINELRKYDLPRLLESNAKLKALFDHGLDSHSDARWKMAAIVMGEWRDMTIQELASFYSECPGAGIFVDSNQLEKGEFNYRDIWKEHTKTARTVATSDFGAVDEDNATSNDLPVGQGMKDRVRLRPSLMQIVPPSQLAPRKWFYRDWLMSGAMTILVAPGGRSKSAFCLSMAIDLSCGVDHLGADLKRPRNVLIYNSEDPKDEMMRRAGAYTELHKFTPDMIQMVGTNLHFQSGVDNKLLFATQEGSKVIENDALIATTIAYIRKHQIEVVILDPLVSLHAVTENDNGPMDKVADIFKYIQGKTGCAILIAHHTRKTQRGQKLEANDSRGAIAVINASRCVLNINDIPADEAANFEITDEPWRYIAISKGDKSNLSPRDPTLMLYRMNSVQADNAAGEFDADNTVALSQHRYTKRMGISDDELLAVLVRLDKTDSPVGATPQHANYIGKVIADVADWDYTNAKVKADIREIVARWMKGKTIKKVAFKPSGSGTKSRKSVDIYVRGDAPFKSKPDVFGAVTDEDKNNAS